MDKERVSFNLVRLKKGGKVFEIAVDPDKALAYKRGEVVDIREVIKAEKIFSDTKKGLLSNEIDEKKIFNTNDFFKIADIILKEGEIQLTAEHRERIIEDKKKRIIEYIHRNSVDPKSGNPHPIKRIELAIEEAKIRINEYKRDEEQIEEIIKKLRTVLPLKIENAVLRITLLPEYAGKLFGDLKRFGEIIKEDWLSNGSLICELKIPAGIQNEVIDSLNKKTKGEINIEKVK